MSITVNKLLTVAGLVLFSRSIYVVHTDIKRVHLVPDEYHSLPTAQHGLQAYIDPDTKQFTPPTRQQQSAQARRILPQTNQLKKIYLPDGTVMLDLREQYYLRGSESDRRGINRL